MAKKILILSLALVALVVMLVVFVKGDNRGFWKDDGRVKVVTTSTMVTDMVKVIGGERIALHGMMDAKVDPHGYQVVARDTAALKGADLVFYSGLHLEGKIQEVLEKREDAYALTRGIPEKLLLKPQEEFEGYHDPHVWGNPGLWAKCVPVVVEALSKADPEGAEEYKKRGEAYQSDLLKLHEWAKKRIAEVPERQRVLVTSHDAFFYFGEAFGFEVRGLQGVSTNSESSIKDRAELVQFIKDRGLKMIFPESSVNAKGIKAVAEEAGVKMSEHELFSDAMGEPGDVVTLHGETYDRGTFIGMIKHNVNTVVDGLK